MPYGPQRELVLPQGVERAGVRAQLRADLGHVPVRAGGEVPGGGRVGGGLARGRERDNRGQS